MKLPPIFRNYRLFIAIGVVMIASSALLTHFFVKQNNEKVEKITQEAAAMEDRIEYMWQQTKAIERREDFGTVLMILSRIDNKPEVMPEISLYIKETLKIAGIENPDEVLPLTRGNKETWLGTLYKIVDEYKVRTIVKIDDIYIEKLELDEKKAEIIQMNSTLSNIALFFQIMGMVLVIIAKPGGTTP